MKKNISLILILLILTSCGSGFSLKKKNVDEFLVEKKNPLVYPPDFGKLPVPDGQRELEDEEKIESFEKTLLKQKEIVTKINKISENRSESLEERIIEKIK